MRAVADPRNTYQWRRIRARWYQWGATHNEPCRNPTCLLPDQPIRYDLRGTIHPAAPNLGHIIEVAEGINPYDESNLRLEHARCNTSAGATYGNRRKNGRPPKGERRAARRL